MSKEQLIDHAMLAAVAHIAWVGEHRVLTPDQCREMLAVNYDDAEELLGLVTAIVEALPPCV